VLNPLYELIAKIILAIHSALTPVFGRDSGVTWALSIVFLTIAMRIVLFPLFVKQIRSQRAMQTLQPKVKELQAKYKGDRERLNAEVMKLYRENNANPLMGCLPLLLQMPVFFALFHVLNHIKPDLVNGQYVYHGTSGISRSLVESAANAKIFDAPIAAAFNSNKALLDFLGASQTAVRVLAVALIVLMGLSTFITQKQMMARSTVTDPQTATVQKFLLYVLPLSFAVFGFQFPLGVLLYWLTTNLWSMGQQAWVIRHMPAPAAAGAPVKPGTAARKLGRAAPSVAADAAASKPSRSAGKAKGNGSAPAPRAGTGPAGNSIGNGADEPGDGTSRPGAGAPSPRVTQQRALSKKAKKGRRGGRR